MQGFSLTIFLFFRAQVEEKDSKISELTEKIESVDELIKSAGNDEDKLQDAQLKIGTI